MGFDFSNNIATANNLRLSSSTRNSIPLIVRGAEGQSENLLVFTNSSDYILSYFDNRGRFHTQEGIFGRLVGSVDSNDVNDFISIPTITTTNLNYVYGTGITCHCEILFVDQNATIGVLEVNDVVLNTSLDIQENSAVTAKSGSTIVIEDGSSIIFNTQTIPNTEIKFYGYEEETNRVQVSKLVNKVTRIHNSEYQITENDYCIICDSTDNTIDLILPNTQICFNLIIKNLKTGTNDITISGGTIDSSTDPVILSVDSSIRLMFDGNEWYSY